MKISKEAIFCSVHKTIIWSICICWFFMNTLYSFGQGAGDAGIGLIDFKTRDEYKVSSQILSFNFLHGISSNERKNSFGLGRTTQTLVIGYGRSMGKKVYLDSKFLVSLIKGRLADNLNISDFMTTLNWKIYSSSKGKFKLGLSSGFKFPLTNSNDRVDIFPLPMLYQTSQGTFDMYSGLSAVYRGGEFVVGGQIPLVSFNRNTFLGYEFPLDDYNSTYYFKRSSDLFIRISWRFKIFKDKISIIPMSQAFFKIKPDEFLNPITKEYIPYIDRYFDFALQANLQISFKINQKISTSIFSGASGNSLRYDGLDRKFQSGLSLYFNL